MDLANVILTGCLALFAMASAAVAFCTMRGANEAAGNQVRAATKQLAASMAPIVADVSQDLLETAGTDRLHDVVVEQDGDAYRVTLPCRNVGPGSAVIEAAVIFLARYDASTRAEVLDPAGRTPAELSVGAIPPGETALIKGSIQPGDPAEAAVARELGLSFCAVVRYTDVAGEQRRMSTIYVIPLSRHPDSYIEIAVRVHECDSDWKPTRLIMRAVRTLRVPTASDRLGTLVEDTITKVTDISERSKKYWDEIDKRMAERGEQLEAAVDRIDPRILRFSQQQSEIDETIAGADSESAHGAGRRRR